MSEAEDRAYYQGWNEALDCLDTAIRRTRKTGDRGLQLARTQWPMSPSFTLKQAVYSERRWRHRNWRDGYWMEAGMKKPTNLILISDAISDDFEIESEDKPFGLAQPNRI